MRIKHIGKLFSIGVIAFIITACGTTSKPQDDDTGTRLPPLNTPSSPTSPKPDTDPGPIIVQPLYLMGTGSSNPTNPTNPTNSANSVLHQDYLDVVNNARAAQQDCGIYGIMPPVDPLVWNDNLYAAAKEHSNDMAESGIYSLNGSGTQFDITAQKTNLNRGSTPIERIEYNGYTSWQNWGENYVRGTNLETAYEVIQVWLNNDIACNILMNRNYEEMGMSMIENANSAYIYYWTLDFGKTR